MPTLDLPENYLQTLNRLLQAHVPEAEVWAYGSRVSGHEHKTSDLDLVLRNPADLSVLQKKLVDLRAALSESGLPILVDVMDWARIPQAFREEIEKEHVVVQKQVCKDVKQKA